jgi:hypothetical protein
VIVRNQLELNVLNISVVNIDVCQAKIDILVQPDLLKLVREVIVISNGEETLGVGGAGYIVNHGVHAGEESGGVSLVVLGRRTTFTLDDSRRFAARISCLGGATIGPYPRWDTFVEG